ncbi:class I SAM-dependent methyltransferase [archaeon]|jgi:ubiquinone/menaquinone biosynthesis C-methylase UbiE|nr:class I SAM-dependent methyltransferase [archaeon]
MKPQQEAVWDSIAAEWNEYRKKEFPVVKNFLKDKTGTILDLGCGSGRNMSNIKDVEWHGVDFSSSMLAHAKENAKDFTIAPQFSHSKSSKLSFKDNSFDSVICYAVLHCVENKEERKKTIDEIYRVLKSGGQALISVWSRKSKVLKNKEKECHIAWRPKDEEDKRSRYTYIFDLEELENLLKESGFKIVSVNEGLNLDFIVEKTE